MGRLTKTVTDQCAQRMRSCVQQSKVVNYQLGNGEEEERIVINRDTVDVEVYAGWQGCCVLVSRQ